MTRPTMRIRSKPLLHGTYRESPTPADLQAIGEFITACSLLEACIHEVIQHNYDIDRDMLKGLLGEPRHGQLTDALKASFALEKHIAHTEELKKELAELYRLMDHINSVRSVVAHKPCMSVAGKMLRFFNGVSAPTKKQWHYHCTKEQLIDAGKCAILLGWALDDIIMTQQEYLHELFADWRKLRTSFDKLLPPNPPRTGPRQTAGQKHPHPI